MGSCASTTGRESDPPSKHHSNIPTPANPGDPPTPERTADQKSGKESRHSRLSPTSPVNNSSAKDLKDKKSSSADANGPPAAGAAPAPAPEAAEDQDLSAPPLSPRKKKEIGKWLEEQPYPNKIEPLAEISYDNEASTDNASSAPSVKSHDPPRSHVGHTEAAVLTADVLRKRDGEVKSSGHLQPAFQPSASQEVGFSQRADSSVQEAKSPPRLAANGEDTATKDYVQTYTEPTQKTEQAPPQAS
eukprot:243181_1